MGEACLNSVTRAAALPPTPTAEPLRHRAFSWYTLKVRSGGEPAAMAALRYLGFDPYCPMRKERRRYSDRMKVVDAAVFAGYVFCRFDAQHKLPIISSPGVEYIVGFSDGPTAVPEEEISNIRRMLDAGASPTRSLPRGQRVRVTHGPLRGVEGVLVRDAAGGDRLVVSIELLNQGAYIEIGQEEVCPIERN